MYDTGDIISEYCQLLDDEAEEYLEKTMGQLEEELTADADRFHRQWSNVSPEAARIERDGRSKLKRPILIEIDG